MKCTKSFAALALATVVGTAAVADETEVKVIGVSIPAATHGWASDDDMAIGVLAAIEAPGAKISSSICGGRRHEGND